MTFPHFSVSSAMRFPYSAGERASTVPPRSAKRAFILGAPAAVAGHGYRKSRQWFGSCPDHPRAIGSATDKLPSKHPAAIPGWGSPSAKERLGHPANDVWTRGFLSGRRGPPNNGKPTSGARMQDLASISGQGWRGRSSLVRALTNRDPPAIAG